MGWTCSGTDRGCPSTIVVSEPVQIDVERHLVEVIVGSGDERRVTFVGECNGAVPPVRVRFT